MFDFLIFSSAISLPCTCNCTSFVWKRACHLLCLFTWLRSWDLTCHLLRVRRTILLLTRPGTRFRYCVFWSTDRQNSVKH